MYDREYSCSPCPVMTTDSRMKTLEAYGDDLCLSLVVETSKKKKMFLTPKKTGLFLLVTSTSQPFFFFYHNNERLPLPTDSF